jgi:ubiquitin-protein ligase
MDQARLKIESTILNKFFPKRFAFVNINSSKAYVDVGVQTNSKKVYRMKIKLPPDYPNSVPKVFITYPEDLKNYNGVSLLSLSASHEMHILNPEDGYIQLCHYKSADWIPSHITIYKVILKCRIWLEGYEWHLRTGLSIDKFVKK